MNSTDAYDIIKKAYILDTGCKFYYTFQSTPHEHSDFEIALVLDDDFKYMLDSETVMLNKGDGIFINSNVSHSLFPLNNNKLSKLFTVRFSPQFIIPNNPDIYNKYVTPVISNPFFKYHTLEASHEKENEILYMLRKIKNLYTKGDFTLELDTRILLCKIWKLILEITDANKQQIMLRGDITYDNRLTAMLTYIHENLSGSISIDNLIQAANITRDTCFKLFKENFNCTPIKYINNYRIQEAIRLIENTNKTISEICYDCGFSSHSYFGKKFKEFTNMSASSYRNSFVDKKVFALESDKARP